MTPEQLLREGLAVYGLPADAAAIEGLEEFSRRLLERNQVMNLTAITLFVPVFYPADLRCSLFIQVIPFSIDLLPACLHLSI